jgi:nitronate monooxygenase
MDKSGLLKRLGIEHPVIQAPMAGAQQPPELVAAASNAGGLGSLGAAYLMPYQIPEAIRRIRALTDYSGPRKLDHRLSYSGGPAKGGR